jgi:hypothetical protein
MARRLVSFFTKIAGVTFEGRQRMIPRCSEGESLRLVRDRTNLYDKGAIKILRSNGEQLGFIPSHVSREGDPSGLAYRMDHGSRYECRIKNITGGGEKSLGVNIEVTEITERESYEDLVQRRLKELKAERHQNDLTSGKISNLAWLIAVVLALLLLAFIVWTAPPQLRIMPCDILVLCRPVGDRAMDFMQIGWDNHSPRCFTSVPCLLLTWTYKTRLRLLA